MCFRIRSSPVTAKNPNICIPFGSKHKSCGDPRLRPGMLSTSTCGMTTLSKSNFESLPRLPKDEGGPVFSEPWEAQAFAMAVKLSELGYFTWKEWAGALAAELQAAADRGEPDDGSRYYHHWLAALEHLVAQKDLLTPEAMADRKEAWAEAYRRTPHGKPVQLTP